MTGRKLLVKSGEAFYALPIEQIVSMIPIAEVHTIPDSPTQVRGTIPFQNRTIPLIDLRLVMGKPSIREERAALVAMLVEREKDHVAWLDDLTDAVREEREFRKTLDPTKCAFGQWYYAFKSNDLIISRALAQFEEPHAMIHKAGGTILQLSREKRKEEALDMIEDARRHTFSLLLRLFAEMRTLLTTHIREIAIILTDGHRHVAVAVDDVIGLKDTNRAETTSGQLTVPSLFLQNAIFLDGTQVNLLKVEPLLAIASNSEHPAQVTA